jgi:hypothetical protein
VVYNKSVYIMQVEKDGKNFLFEDIISETHTYTIPKFSKIFERYGPGKELTEKFRLCDNDWLFIFKPCDDDTDSASAFISNLSVKSIGASYKISISNRDSDCNIVFTDPEGMVLFDADGGGNDTWVYIHIYICIYIYMYRLGFVCIYIYI